jgi:hypothetical protein
MSYVAVDVFLQKLQRYLRVGLGLTDVDDLSDVLLDHLDGYAYRWFQSKKNKKTPYMFSDFSKDLKQRYVPVDYVSKLIDEYEKVRQGSRTFDDYHTELLDYENMLDDELTTTMKFKTLKKGLRMDLHRAMIVHERLGIDEYVATASAIDHSMQEERTKDSGKEPAKSNARTRNAFSSTSKSATSTTSTTPKGPRKQTPELKPEISYEEVRKNGLCRHCKEKATCERIVPF